MAGLQSGNKIWEDWLRKSLSTMINLRYCMTLKFEWTKAKSGSQGKVAVKEISSRSIPMQGIKSVLNNVTNNKLKVKHKG